MLTPELVGSPVRRRLNLALDEAPDAPTIARRATAAINPQLGEERRSDLELLVSELVTNSIRHGTGNGSQIALEIAMMDEMVHVEVTDAGSDSVPKLQEPDYERGTRWGLHLVDAIAERWGVDRGERTRVWFELSLS